MRLRRIFWIAAVFVLSCSAPVNGNDEVWVATWTTANADFTAPPALAIAGSAHAPLTFSNQTLRQIVHITVGGVAVRLRLSNVFGAQPVTFDSVFLGLQKDGAGVVPGSNHEVTFGGSKSVTIREGAEAISDATVFRVADGQNLAISLFLPGSSPAATVHGSALQTNYFSTAGNLASAETAEAFATKIQSWYFLEGLDVIPASEVKGAIVALGDSITDGASARADANERWTDVLARRLQIEKPKTVFSVLNTGIGGNRVLSTSPCFGVNAIARLQRDVFSQPGVRYVILFEGTNDIGQPDTPSAAIPAAIVPCLSRVQITAPELIAGYKQIVWQAHGRGLKVFGATILPYQGFGGWTASGEAKRQAVNAWIRASGNFDGVIDFDAALADPHSRSKMDARYDSGDHLHPSPAGHEAMARAIDLSLFQ